ncbi:hypothetical protein ACLSZW_05915 [Avibacterium avium]|uniref:DUF1281 family ferredoxin-like fold protein n=1 Tax=Avibacterium avium TaxID=751 RepID=UPI003BF86158
MPNWCENKLEISVSNATQLADVKAKLFSFDENNEQQLDFNLIVPMPEAMRIDSGAIGYCSQALLETFPHQLLTLERLEELIPHCAESQYERIKKLALSQMWTVGDFIQWLKQYPEEQPACHLDLQLGQQYIDNMKRYGCTDWYHWACQYWGTKSNGYLGYTEESKTHITFWFDTAWTPPEPWFIALCQHFPTFYMHLYYYEPGCFFAGEMVSDEQGEGVKIIAETDEEIKYIAQQHFGEEFDEEFDN